MSQIRIKPVGNGDQILVILDDGTTIQIDCNIREKSLGCTDGTMCDVKKDLLSHLQKRNGYPFVDVFVLTHGDQDHCRGFRKHFYKGNPTKYAKANLEAGEVMIDEMWFSPMIAEEYTNDDEDAYQQEAERRLALHMDDHPDRNLPGNRIRIIGYDGSKDYQKLNHLRSIPGNIVNRLNHRDQDCFSFFIHAPFKETLASADAEGKNTNSIVLQARFKELPNDTEFSNLFMFGGDSDYIAWELILEKTIDAKNDTKQFALDWDVFVSTHHCSWTFFNEHDCKDEPRASALEVLKYRREGGVVIASSKPIEDNDDNPPSHLAKETYISKLDGKHQFLCTSEDTKGPGNEPIVFVTTPNGPARDNTGKVKAAATAAGGSGASGNKSTQG